LVAKLGGTGSLTKPGNMPAAGSYRIGNHVQGMWGKLYFQNIV